MESVSRRSIRSLHSSSYANDESKRASCLHRTVSRSPLVGFRSSDGCRPTVRRATRTDRTENIRHRWSIEGKTSAHFDMPQSFSVILAWMGEYVAFVAFSYTPFLSAAWTTAAVDNKRVIGAMPIVMDMLNLQKVERSFQTNPNDGQYSLCP